MCIRPSRLSMQEGATSRKSGGVGALWDVAELPRHVGESSHDDEHPVGRFQHGWRGVGLKLQELQLRHQRGQRIVECVLQCTSRTVARRSSTRRIGHGLGGA